uniref:(northern house mosquito) hypothetical protein n=1 Tax=Culex pipiens TaxID=7175 RepID=A0A8D8BN36_CULPI
MVLPMLSCFWKMFSSRIRRISLPFSSTTKGRDCSSSVVGLLPEWLEVVSVGSDSSEISSSASLNSVTFSICFTAVALSSSTSLSLGTSNSCCDLTSSNDLLEVSIFSFKSSEPTSSGEL